MNNPLYFHPDLVETRSRDVYISDDFIWHHKEWTDMARLLVLERIWLACESPGTHVGTVLQMSRKKDDHKKKWIHARIYAKY